MTRHIPTALLTAALLWAAAPGHAHAYIDPNTGGLLFQFLAVMLAAASGMVLFFSRHLKEFMARIRRFVRERGISE